MRSYYFCCWWWCFVFVFCLKVFVCILMTDQEIFKKQDLSAERDSVANTSMDEVMGQYPVLLFPAPKASGWFKGAHRGAYPSAAVSGQDKSYCLFSAKSSSVKYTKIDDGPVVLPVEYSFHSKTKNKKKQPWGTAKLPSDVERTHSAGSGAWPHPLVWTGWGRMAFHVGEKNQACQLGWKLGSQTG